MSASPSFSHAGSLIPIVAFALYVIYVRRRFPVLFRLSRRRPRSRILWWPADFFVRLLYFELCMVYIVGILSDGLALSDWSRLVPVAGAEPTNQGRTSGIQIRTARNPCPWSQARAKCLHHRMRYELMYLYSSGIIYAQRMQKN